MQLIRFSELKSLGPLDKDAPRRGSKNKDQQGTLAVRLRLLHFPVSDKKTYRH